VAACNTASGAALEQLREALAIPVVGLEPAVKTGATVTRNGRVGVMATAGTLTSARYARLVREHARGVEVHPQPCPGLADLIEEGHLDDERLRARLEQFTRPLRDAGVDTVILGCTHYPLVAPMLQRVLGRDVSLVTAGHAIAATVQRVLEEGGLAKSGNEEGTYRFLCTGDPEAFRELGTRFLQLPLGKVERIELP
jgi:glutamate racemase